MYALKIGEILEKDGPLTSLDQVDMGIWTEVASDASATSNTKLEVTKDVESISATTKYKPRESGKELSVGKDNGEELLLLAIMDMLGPQLGHRLIDVMEACDVPLR